MYWLKGEGQKLMSSFKPQEQNKGTSTVKTKCYLLSLLLGSADFYSISSFKLKYVKV